jgi:DNA mismatch repair protein MutS
MDELYFRHYREYSAKYSGNQVAILLLVGKFYEMYDSIADGKGITHVQAAAAACGCSVEPKSTDDPARQRIFWGFPEVALDKYERMLVAAGYTVVVFDQAKNGTGAVVGRPLHRISSPGTYFDPEEKRREDTILLGICVEPYTDASKSQAHWYGAASSFDVATGQLRSIEFDLLLLDDTPVTDSIRPFLAMFPPAEIVFTWCAPTAALPTEERVRSVFTGTDTAARIHIQRASKEDGGAAADRTRMEFLRGIFRPQTALSLERWLDIEMYPFVRRSLAHLLSFIKDHNASFLVALPQHALWSAETACVLGNAALHQLAMIPPHAEKAEESLLHWIQKATTTMGKRVIRERCMKPTADVALLEDRQERIARLRCAKRDAFFAELKGVCDLPRLYRRFQLGTAGTTELVQLLHSYARIAKLLELAGKGADDVLRVHVDALLDTWDAERIKASEAIVADRLAIGGTHPWRRGRRPALDALEDRWAVLYADQMAQKAAWCEALSDSDAIAWTLKEEAPFTFTTTARRGRLLEAHDRSLKAEARGSSSTVTLLAPSVKAATLVAVALRSEWRTAAADLWASEWRAWSDANTNNGVLASLIDFVGELDADCGLALAADLYGYVRPVYVEEESSGLEVVEMRHPILERVHTSSPYVSHSLSMGCFHKEDAVENRASTPCGLLLYGVNAAGKSSLGKALGLTVLMAQIGMPVPATALRLVPYTGLFTRILGNDNLWAGLSSFVVEMTELRSILKYADERSLVIGDELCAGTETESAIALVSAGVQTLIKRGVHFFFATHLHELGKELDDVGVRSYHLTVKAVGSTLQYDRLLKEGSGSEMYGLEVCRGLDLDSEFLSLAFAIRKRRCETAGKPSRYNAAVTVSSCARCGSREGLETHHIVPRSAAVNGKIGAGVSVNTVSNLVVLCEKCHLDHHGGRVTIEGWKDTTEGRRLN